MKFKELILKNIKYNIKNYISYITGISAILSILFMFFNFLYSEVFLEKSKEIFKGPDVEWLKYIMLLLTILFVFYIAIIFTKTKGKELGVYYTIGLTSKQILKILFYENIVISITSIFIGLTIGIVFSKLFNMAFLKAMNIDKIISIGLNKNGFVIVLLISLLVFVLMCLYQRFFLMKNSIVNIIKSNSKNECYGKGELFKGIVSFIVLFLSGNSLLGYVLQTEGPSKSLDGRLVILFLISLYFFTGFCMIIVERILRLFKGIYNSNIVVIKTLSCRFLSYRTTIFVAMVMMTCGLIFTAEGVGYKQLGGAYIDRDYKYDLSFIVNKEQLENNDFKNIIEKYAGKIKEYDEIENIEEHYIQKSKENDHYFLGSIRIISNEEYIKKTQSNKFLNDNELIAPLNNYKITNGDIILKLDGGEGEYITHKLFIHGFSDLGKYKQENNNSNFIEFNKENIVNETMKITNPIYDDIGDIRPGFLVVSDNLYTELKNNSKNVYYDICINLENNKDYKVLYKELSTELYSIGGEEISETLTIKDYTKYKEVSKCSVVYFIFVFLGAIFLVGSGLALYFKIFTSLNEDVSKKNSLYRIGLTAYEIKKIIYKEITIVFLVPAIISLSVSGMYFNYTFVNGENGELAKRIMIYIFTFYIVIYFIIYEISKRSYIKKVFSSR